MDDEQPWVRAAGESDVAYAAFLAYRDLGSARSTAKVGRALGKSADLMQRWSARWAWVARALAWDVNQQQIVDRARTEVRRQAVDQHGATARGLLVIVSRLLAPPEGATPNWVPSLNAVAVASNAMDKAIHHQRLALGLPSDVTRTEHDLRATIQEGEETMRIVRAVLEEHLCDDCRERVAVQLTAIVGHHERLRARLAG